MDERKVKEETDPPDGGYGWWIVFAIILINSSLLNLVQCFGIIFKDEFSLMGITAAETSFLLHLHSSIYCSFGFFGSPLLKKYGFRLIAFAGALLMCFGIFLSSFANNYSFLIFSVSILVGLGQGMIMPATYLATYTYFKKRLTLAVSISATGASLSSILMPTICGSLLTHVGRRYTVLTLFAISLLSFVGCYLLKPIKKENQPYFQVIEPLYQTDEKCEESPQEKEEVTELIQVIKPLNKTDEKCVRFSSQEKEEVIETIQVTEPLNQTDEKCVENPQEKGEVIELITNSNPVYKDTTVPVKELTLLRKIYNIFDLQLLQQTSYVLVVIGLGISFGAELNIILLMQFVLPELFQFSRTEVVLAISAQYLCDIIGRLAIPFVSHSYDVPPKFMYAGALVIATVARTILSIWGTTHIIVYFCCSLIGLTKGARAVFQSVIIPKYVPLEKIPAANGLHMLFTGAVSLMIGPIIGAVHDKTNSYNPALHTASAFSCSCVLLWVFEYIYLKRKAAINES